jgi:ssDNA-binding Zn-finger/Zn-ribbon topoisomerase 1
VLASDIKCPVCGSETALRTAKKGFDAGKQFYLCNHYPECKGRISYEAQCERIELGKLKEKYEQDAQIARAEFEKYKETQEQIVQDEMTDFRRSRATHEQIMKNERARLEELEKLYNKDKSVLQAEIEKQLETRVKELENNEAAFNQLVKEKTQGFPYLAEAYIQYSRLCDMRIANKLITKDHPAWKASSEIRQMSKERREAEKAAMISNNLLQYCKFLAPWLEDYIGIEANELDEIIQEIHSSWEKKEKELDEDVKRQIGPSVWNSLTPTEKLQRKLDWYWEKPNKTNWQLGRDYENYIGHLYELKGWAVYFHGAKGFEDLGRDLICKKDGCVEIIQCKNWSQSKTIHEKNIYYLFGTTVEYYIENFGKLEDLQLSLIPTHIEQRELTPKLVTTTSISPKAEQVAEALKVVIERIPFQRYPSVKCNVSRRTGEKIYHLPFDQQYETILIEEDKLECYVETVAEAERLGFRHAFKWTGDSESSS